MLFPSINPYNGAIIAQHNLNTEKEVEQILQRAGEASEKWATSSLLFRISCLENCQKLLQKDKEKLAILITQEMGKLIGESEQEIDKCIALCKFYSGHLEKFLSPKNLFDNDAPHQIFFEPLGVVLGIMPWNFPFWQVFRFAIPAISAGNAVLIKHATNVLGCSKAIASIFLEAGFYEGVYQNIILGHDLVERVIAHRTIKAVSLTGSEKAGSAIASLAGKYLKKTVLELGSNDAFIVLKDADIASAATWAAKSRLINNGQSCIAAKRFIIEEEVYDEFFQNFQQEFGKIQMGNPMDLATTLGPLARKDLCNDLKEQIAQSIKLGAIEQKFGVEISSPNTFMNPTILTNISINSPAYTEELFGPVASIFKVKNKDQAITLANDSKFGLATSVWTNNESDIALLTNKLNVGGVFINMMVQSHPAIPFGGVKNSGYGRELGEYGFKEFVNVKTLRKNL